MMVELNQFPKKGIRSHSNLLITSVSSEHLMARRKLAQWSAPKK
ncbi:hypothetical protein CCH79_00004591 [Gambusia affinis]|uniref:Uncharacterized protein n=1 Tax=Gambusia affinis TaxID=33528 RepID=A0A315UXV9_GAMAF|nr:hypothetical protein CCH79_00004591 [Gambusia affinis]